MRLAETRQLQLLLVVQAYAAHVNSGWRLFSEALDVKLGALRENYAGSLSGGFRVGLDRAVRRQGSGLPHA